MKKKINIALVVLYLLLCTSMFIIVIINTHSKTQSNMFETVSDYKLNMHGTESQVELKIKSEDIGRYLIFKTRDSYVEVSVGGTTIYNFTKGNSIIDSPGTSWHVIKLTDECKDEDLIIKIQSESIRKQADNINMYLKDGIDVMNTLLSIEMKDVVSNIIMLCISIMLLIVIIINIVYRKPLNDIVASICLFFATLCVTTWTSSELYLVQLIIPNPTIRYFMYYIAFQCIPLFVSCYLMTREKVPDTDLNISYIVFLIILNTLHIIRVIQLHNTSIIFIVIAMAYMIKSLINYITDYNTRSVKLIAVGVITLLFCLALNTVQFITKAAGDYTLTTAKVGFIFFLLIISISNILDQLYRDKNIEQYKVAAKYARTDYLTGLKNRLALSQDFEFIDKDKIAILSIDLNNLKYYNDVYGHKMGDALLKSASNVLVKVFGQDSVYRIGGDEFVGMCQASDNIEEIRKTISSECLKEESNIRDEIILEIAIGGCFDVNKEESLDSALHEADEDMYVDKHNIKLHSRLNKGNYVDSRLK